MNAIPLFNPWLHKYFTVAEVVAATGRKDAFIIAFVLVFAYPLAEETLLWQPGSKLSQENAVAENNWYTFVMLVSSWSDSPVWFPMCLPKCSEKAFRSSIRLTCA